MYSMVQAHDEHEGGLPGTVKLVFQPFEEGGAGADILLNTGALDDVQVLLLKYNDDLCFCMTLCDPHIIC